MTYFEAPRPHSTSARVAASATIAAAVIAGSILFAGPASAGETAPASCAAVAASHPGSADGNYMLTVGGKSLNVWCADMATTPVPYLTFVHSENSQNTSMWNGGEGPAAITSFTKVKLVLPASATDRFGIDTEDYRFASTVNQDPSTGGEAYGKAAGCKEWPASAVGDLRGTPFAFNASEFTVGGWAAWGWSTLSSNGQVVSSSGSGGCGGTYPVNRIMKLDWLGSVSTASTTVTAGTRSANLANLTLGSAESGTTNYSQVDQTATGSAVLSVDDSTGSGAGWAVSTQGTDFVWSADGGAATSAPNIAAAKFSVTSVGAVTTTAGTAWSAAPVAVTGALDTPVTLLSASANNGDGSYTMPVNVSLTIPGATRSGTYSATLTTTISNAP